MPSREHALDEAIILAAPSSIGHEKDCQRRASADHQRNLLTIYIRVQPPLRCNLRPSPRPAHVSRRGQAGTAGTGAEHHFQKQPAARITTSLNRQARAPAREPELAAIILTRSLRVEIPRILGSPPRNESTVDNCA